MQLWRKRPFDETLFDKHGKIAEANEKLNFQILHIKLDEGVGDDFQIIISTKSKAVEGNHSGESEIRRIYVTFLEKHFSTKVY